MLVVRGGRAGMRAPWLRGVLVRELLDDHVRLPVAEAARRMDASRQSLHAVLSGASAVTAAMALRFGKLVGGAPELYVSMQMAHDLWQARQKLRDALERIEPVAL